MSIEQNVKQPRGVAFWVTSTAEFSDPYHPQPNDHILKAILPPYRPAFDRVTGLQPSTEALSKHDLGKNNIKLTKTRGWVMLKHIKNINYTCIEHHRLVKSNIRAIKEWIFTLNSVISLQTQSSLWGAPMKKSESLNKCIAKPGAIYSHRRRQQRWLQIKLVCNWIVF